MFYIDMRTQVEGYEARTTSRIRLECDGNQRIMDIVFQTRTHWNFPLIFPLYPVDNDWKAAAIIR
jgi:hypothetical protein